MRSKFVRALTFLSVLMLIQGVGGYAQTSVDGAIGGTVQDSTGAVISQAQVVVHNNGTQRRAGPDDRCVGLFSCSASDPWIIHGEDFRSGILSL
jgi:hypothetical protein